jgi:hypothetical protein
VPPAIGWLVLLGVFADEVLAAVAVGIGGHDRLGLLGAVLGPVVVVGLWWTFASPKAPLGGPVLRPVVKVLVFGVATVALWSAGHGGWAAAFLVFSVVVNALALLPSVRSLVPDAT